MGSKNARNWEQWRQRCANRLSLPKLIKIIFKKRCVEANKIVEAKFTSLGNGQDPL